jgi:hypothetical protein
VKIAVTSPVKKITVIVYSLMDLLAAVKVRDTSFGMTWLQVRILSPALAGVAQWQSA